MDGSKKARCSQTLERSFEPSSDAIAHLLLALQRVARCQGIE